MRGRHSSIQISYRGDRVIIGRGADWLRSGGRIDAEAILLTHAHPDHAWGLKNGAPCPVYATDATWRSIERFPVAERAVVVPRSVKHSLGACHGGYRITAGASAVFTHLAHIVRSDRREIDRAVRDLEQAAATQREQRLACGDVWHRGSRRAVDCKRHDGRALDRHGCRQADSVPDILARPSGLLGCEHRFQRRVCRAAKNCLKAMCCRWMRTRARFTPTG